VSTPRIEQLRARMAEQQLPAALIASSKNVGYLSGFSGSTAMLVVTADRALFITDSRYGIQAAAECPGCEIVVIENSGEYLDALAAQTEKLGIDTLGVEAERVTLAQFDKFREKLPKLELKPAAQLVDPLRLVKDEHEMPAIRRACALVDAVFEKLLGLLRPGVVERHVAAALEYELMLQGSEGAPFSTIVASGPRSALPHGRASDRTLQPGDLVTIDYGARVDGYVSDITRTIVLGPASEKQREVHQTVLDAQAAGIRAIRAGAHGKDVDSAAREVIKERGYGDHFGHGLGHGIGLDVHDHMALSQKSELTLQAGMVVTVEPGIYIENWGGVRIEDDVLVTHDGCEVLTHVPRHLIELPV
jgi:Xaa-Pro aminopeptidase